MSPRPEDNYQPGGPLDQAQHGRPPHLRLVASTAEATIETMRLAESPGLQDFGPPDRYGRRRPGPTFWHEFARATRLVETFYSDLVRQRTITPTHWAEVASAPAQGADRALKIARLGAHWARRGDSDEELLAQLLAVDRATNLPPLGSFEVEAICRWALDRRDERGSR